MFGGTTVDIQNNWRQAAHRNCPKIFHGPSQITPAHPSSYIMTGPLPRTNLNACINTLSVKRMLKPTQQRCFIFTSEQNFHHKEA
jgi:hypothetical protein